VHSILVFSIRVHSILERLSILAVSIQQLHSILECLPSLNLSHSLNLSLNLSLNRSLSHSRSRQPKL